MIRGRGSIICVLLLSVLPGCLVEERPTSILDLDGPLGLHTAVVGLMDAGINPYHEVFRAPEGRGAERWAEQFGATVITLTQAGTLEQRIAADEQTWRGMEPGRLYAFAGTRVLAVSISRAEELPILDPQGHGTGTASMVALAAPDALIAFAQFDSRYCDYAQPSEHCPIVVPMAPAMAWLAAQPWIDVISSSHGYPGSPPMFFGPDEGPYLAATRLASEKGKVLVAAAGNSVTPGILHPYQGPPWLVSVGGAEPTQQGESLLAAKGADVVANYSVRVAEHDSVDGWAETAGTSFGAPTVAGTLSRALALVREARPGEPVPPAVLRAALNASALVWGPSQWRPEPPTAANLLGELGRQSVPAAAPAQIGWGYVGASLAPEIARRVLEGDLEPPPEKAATAAYMAQWQAMREAYWGRPAP